MADETPKHQREPEAGRAKVPMPAEGPHAREELIDREKTPGTGSLPGPNGAESDIGPD